METTLALGKTIPVPRSGPGYSGKFQVRLPAGLHEAVALEAEHEGVSLNAYVSTVCWPGRSVGRATSGPEARGTRSSKPQDRPVPVS